MEERECRQKKQEKCETELLVKKKKELTVLFFVTSNFIYATNKLIT